MHYGVDLMIQYQFQSSLTSHLSTFSTASNNHSKLWYFWFDTKSQLSNSVDYTSKYI